MHWRRIPMKALTLHQPWASLIADGRRAAIRFRSHAATNGSISLYILTCPP